MEGKDCCLWQLTTSAPSENFPDTLNCAEVKIIPQHQCEKAYPGQVTDSMVCASDSSGADTCQVSAFGNSLFYLFIFGCAGSPWLCSGFLQLQRTGWGVCGGRGFLFAEAQEPLIALLLPSADSRRVNSVVVAPRLSSSAACGIFPGQGSNPSPLHWQADSYPLGHRGRPETSFFPHSPCRDVRLGSGVIPKSQHPSLYRVGSEFRGGTFSLQAAQRKNQNN